MCVFVCVCMLVTQLCLAICDPMDCSLSGFCVHGILLARILEGWFQDGRGIGRGDHFLPHIFIKRSFEQLPQNNF